MDRCAGEFEKLASECASFADKGKRFAETEKRAFFKLMQGRATAIFDSVKAFQMVAISAEIDLECLPAADDNLIEAVAAQEGAELAVAAASVVKETLAPALNEYCFAMDRCAGEFEKLASECASFADKGKRFAETEKRAFFKLMQGRATAIFDSVKAFQMVAISAEIDLECLPAAPEPNYVQQWLAQARASQPSFAQRILGLRNKIPCLKEVAE